MIVRVMAQITSDDGMPVVMADVAELVVQIEDFEANVLMGAAKLDELFADARRRAQAQVEAHRTADPPPAPAPEPPQYGGRRRR